MIKVEVLRVHKAFEGVFRVGDIVKLTNQAKTVISSRNGEKYNVYDTVNCFGNDKSISYCYKKI